MVDNDEDDNDDDASIIPVASPKARALDDERHRSSHGIEREFKSISISFSLLISAPKPP